jgi:hypothetical protein
MVRASVVPSLEDELDDLGTAIGVVSKDMSEVKLAAITLTDEPIEVICTEIIQLSDKTFETDGHDEIVQVNYGRTKHGEIVVSNITYKINRYDFIIAYEGIGTKERPFKQVANIGYLQFANHDHSELGVFVDPKDKVFKHVFGYYSYRCT